jgi:hypothetical protein
MISILLSSRWLGFHKGLKAAYRTRVILWSLFCLDPIAVRTQMPEVDDLNPPIFEAAARRRCLQIGVGVGDEKTLEYCDHDSTINRVPTTLPFASDKYAFERKAYEDFLDLLLNPAPSQSEAAKAPKNNPPDSPCSALKNEPAGVTTSEPPPLPAADFSILGAKRAAPVKKAWWKFW